MWREDGRGSWARRIRGRRSTPGVGHGVDRGRDPHEVGRGVGRRRDPLERWAAVHVAGATLRRVESQGGSRARPTPCAATGKKMIYTYMAIAKEMITHKFERRRKAPHKEMFSLSLLIQSGSRKLGRGRCCGHSRERNPPQGRVAGSQARSAPGVGHGVGCGATHPKGGSRARPTRGRRRRRRRIADRPSPRCCSPLTLMSFTH